MKKIILSVLFSLNNNSIQSAAKKPINPPQASAKTPSFQDLKNLFETTRLDTKAFNTIFPQIKDGLTLDQINTIKRLNSNQKSRWVTNIAKTLEALADQKKQSDVDSSSLQDSLEQEQGSFARLNELLSDPEVFIKRLRKSHAKITNPEIETLMYNNRLGFCDPEIEDALNRILQQRNTEMLSSLQESLQESTQGPSPEPSERALITQEPGLTAGQLQDLADALN